MDYKKMLEIVKMAAKEAGEAIIKIYNSDFDVEYKSDDSPLTCADKEADRIIVSILKEKFPSYAVLSEESVDDLSRLDNEYCWIVDPLDGTKEFVNHTDEFTVNIALAKNGVSILGVIYVPVTEEMYYAFAGGGSFYSKNSVLKKINVSTRITNLRFVSSKYHKSDEFLDILENNSENISAVQRIGSSLKGCLIARGNAECYYRHGLTSEWDTAAMQIIVEEAGGVFKQLDETDMLYNRIDTLNRKGFYVLNRKENHITN